MSKMTKAAVAVALSLVTPAIAADRTFTATPNADGSYTLRESRAGAGWGWRGTLPDGRAYRVLGEPSAGSPLAYVEVVGEPPSYSWVPAAWVCPDEDLLMRLSAARRLG